MTIQGIPNPDLVTGRDNKARWNQPDTRRQGFHGLHTRARYALSFRSPSVLPLYKRIDWTIRRHPGVAEILEAPALLRVRCRARRARDLRGIRA